MASTLPVLQRLAIVARHRYRTIFAVAAVIVAVSLGLASRLKFDTDITNLLPRKDPVIRTFLDTLNRFGSIDYLLVAVRVPEGVALDPYETFVDRLGERLAELPEMAEVEYRLGDPGELLRELYPKAVLFLDEEGRERLAEKLSDEGIRDRMAEVRRMIATPQGMAAKELLALDPFGLSELFLGRLQASRGSLSVEWTSGYYLSRDHRMLLILAKPQRPPQDIDFVERMVAAVEREAATVAADWDEISGVDAAEDLAPGRSPAPEVALGGSYLTALDDARFIRSDAVLNGVVSLVLVIGLFLFAFRRWGPLMFANVPLACGLAVSFGFTQLAFGGLSSATSGTAALLVGLGVDFTIVSYGRYVEERRRGASLEQALKEMSGSTGRAVVTGAVTTTATFYAFAVTDVTGLVQMGILTGTGILFCMLATLFLLPAMLAWREDRHAARQSEPNLYLHSFGTRPLMELSMRRPWTTLAVGGAVTVVAAVLASGLEFQESMETMRPPENRGVRVTKEVGERFGSGFDYMMLVVEGEDPEGAIRSAARAAAGAQKLVDAGVLYGFSGIHTLIPSPEQQDSVLRWLASERKAGALRMDRIHASFQAALAEQGLRPEPFGAGIEMLDAALSPTGPLGVAEFSTTQQARTLLARFLQSDEKGWKSVVYLYPPQNRWRREPPPEAEALTAELGPKAVLTGTNVVNQYMRRTVRADAWAAAGLGLLLVTLLIWIDFRSLRLTLLALIPLGVGLLWMGGAMGAFGLQLNFMNIFVTTMIIGIGVDYGVHVLHRYREARDLDEAAHHAALVETGSAIIIAALSTISGFGSLAVSHYPGLRSVGYVATLGALATSLVATTLLPAFLVLRRRARIRASGSSGS